MDNEEAGGVKCGRWNPTNGQVKVLMDLFRTGLRTPTADQIQKISSHLSAFGKIESKNVFYWFQNHKARERHLVIKKRRRGSGGVSGGSCGDFTNGDGFVLNTARKDAPYVEALVTWEYMDGRDAETLELFPMTSHCSYESSEDRRITSEISRNYEYCTGESSFHSDNNGLERRLEPQLDLRLSFL